MIFKVRYQPTLTDHPSTYYLVPNRSTAIQQSKLATKCAGEDGVEVAQEMANRETLLAAEEAQKLSISPAVIFEEKSRSSGKT